MERKVGRASIIMNKLAKILCFAWLVLTACDNNGSEIEQDTMPLPSPFNFFINLDLPAAQSLQFENHLYLPDYGLRGLVVVKLENGYVTYDRICPVSPDDECSQVNFINAGTTNSYLQCKCGEAFYRARDGFPTNSPEPRKLREYYTEYSGNTLYIESTIR